MMPNPPIAPLPVVFPLYPEPPFLWRDDRALSFLCRVDPGVLARVVPEPLKLERSDGVLVIAVKVCRNLSLPEGRSWPTKLATQYRLDFTVPVVFEGEPAEYPFLEYINDDMGLCVGRELWSWPKKLGAFVWQEEGESLHVECRRGDELLLTADFAPSSEDAGAVEWPHASQAFTVRHTVPTGRGHQPAQAEVLRTGFPNFNLTSRFSGEGQLSLFDGSCDPLRRFFGGVDVLDARFDVRDFDFDWPEVVATVDLPVREPAVAAAGSPSSGIGGGL
jgi:acetoacetate decarboxylase